MKVLSFDRRSGQDIYSPLGVDIMPDSSIIKDGKPFFVPSFSDKWSYHAGLALRNGRLGKNVGERFASRYLDAMALCIITRPDDAIESHAGVQHGLLNCYEGAVIFGDWQPVADPAAFLSATVGDCTVDFTGEIESAYRLFAQSSAVCVMKIGDIIVTCRDRIACDMPVDTLVTGSLNGVESLHFRIK